MNKLDKSFYRALSLLANNTRNEVKELKEKNTGIYEKNVPSTDDNPVEQTLNNWGYVNLKGHTRWIITQNGLEQLRDLEKIKHRDNIIFWAVFAVVISVIALAKSMGWF